MKILEENLTKTCNIKEAIRIIKLGYDDEKTLSKITGLSEEEINFLKIKLSEKKITYLSVMGRERVIALLLKSEDPKAIQNKTGITDFEMEDIKNQVIYRKRKGFALRILFIV